MATLGVVNTGRLFQNSQTFYSYPLQVIFCFMGLVFLLSWQSALAVFIGIVRTKRSLLISMSSYRYFLHVTSGVTLYMRTQIANTYLSNQSGSATEDVCMCRRTAPPRRDVAVPTKTNNNGAPGIEKRFAQLEAGWILTCGILH